MTEQQWLICTDPAPMLECLRGKTRDSFDALFDERQPFEAIEKLRRGQMVKRKLRLFASGCARSVWNVLEEQSRRVVELSEQYADGSASQTVLEAALERVRRFRATIPSFEEPGYLHFLGEVENFGYWRCRRPLEESAAELVLGLGPGLEAEHVAKKAAEVAAGLARADAWVADLAVREETIDFPARDARGDASYQARRLEETQAQSTLLRDIFGNPFQTLTVDRSWVTPKMRNLAQSIYAQRRFQDTRELADALEAGGCAIREMLDHCRVAGPHVRGCWVVDVVLGKS